MQYIKQCTHEPEYVMGVDEVDYHGADQRGAAAFIGDLMINFTRDSDIPSVINIPELSPHINIGFEEEIMVPWADFGAPLVQPSFWEALHGYIRKQGWKTVCFHCEAGHGRTGTALACILISIQGYSTEEAVWHVRTNYCEEAVETHEQCRYLQAIDEYYNDRESSEEDMPIPSMVFQMQRAQAAREAQQTKQAPQEDKYEGFKGVKSG